MLSGEDGPLSTDRFTDDRCATRTEHPAKAENRRRAVRISRDTSFGYSMPEAAHIRGNIDVDVNPGIVLISFR